MNPEILHLDPLDGQRDAARGVDDGVARGAVLESFVFDVVTQQLVVRAPPLYRQLRDVSVVLIVVRTRQSDALTRLTQHSYNTAWRQKSSLSDGQSTNLYYYPTYESPHYLYRERSHLQ